MFKKVSIIFTISSLAFASSAFAASGWSGQATIEGIYALDDERVLIKLSNFNNPHGCLVNSNGDVIINSKTHSNWFSMALTAYTASQKVDIYVVSHCEVVWADTSYAKVGHFRLK